MSLNCRFAIISDPHIAISQTIRDRVNRFHLVEVSIPAFEKALQHLEQLALDFLLLPGDLTQDGEFENHQWLQQRLLSLPFPVYVIPGNHDVPSLAATESTIGLKDFPYYYRQHGYDNPHKLYYTKELLPGLQLIALNSNHFDAQGKQIGSLDRPQLAWLDQILPEVNHKLVLVMIHHNVVEHLPGQAQHPLGKRYMLDNASTLKQILQKHGVKLVFSGHLHVQDIACEQGVYDITTGSLVSYPHPYRILGLQTDSEGKYQLTVESYRVENLPEWENLLERSREWMGDRSFPFMLRLLMDEPLSLSQVEAASIAPLLRYFWADIAAGDARFDFPELPPTIRHYLEQFGANKSQLPALIDNNATILL